MTHCLLGPRRSSIGFQERETCSYSCMATPARRCLKTRPNAMSASPTSSPDLRAWSRRDFVKATGAFAVLLGWGGPFGREVRAAFANPLEAQQYHFLSRISWGVKVED